MAGVRTIIIDDEPHCIGALEILVRDFIPSLRIEGTARSALEGVKLITDINPELVFLDIAMPGMTGFQLLESIEERNFDVIFTTAYDSYAIHAFKVNAVDYLMKPVEVQELIKSVDRFFDRNRHQGQNPGDTRQWELLIENLAADKKRNATVSLPTFTGIELVPVKEILYVEADGNYTKLLLEGNRSLLISKTLKEIEKALAKFNFIRIHHSYLANVHRIRRYVKGDGGYVVVDNGTQLSVSRRRRDALLNALNTL